MVVYQVNARHAKLLIRELGLEQGTGPRDGSRNASRAPKSASTAPGIEISCTIQLSEAMKPECAE